jgi:hypothetical protein
LSLELDFKKNSITIELVYSELKIPERGALFGKILTQQKIL